MFAELFAESGLSLDRLRSLLEVGAAGSIVKATAGDPVKQSQYSRQIKELEDFFRVKLIERHGKGIRLTASGKELARISRFFLLGLSNFQRGCITAEQTFRIGASATFIRHFLLPALSERAVVQGRFRYVTEIALDDEIERRLHDLTLDFGVTTAREISRPLQLERLGTWELKLWAPRTLHRTKHDARQAFRELQLPLILPCRELDLRAIPALLDYPARLFCDDFLQAAAATIQGSVGVVLPDFMAPASSGLWEVPVPALSSATFQYQLAWNPRLLRLNPHATRRRDALKESLIGRMQGTPRQHTLTPSDLPRAARPRPAGSSS